MLPEFCNLEEGKSQHYQKYSSLMLQSGMPASLLTFPLVQEYPVAKSHNGVGSDASWQVMWHRQRWGTSGLVAVLRHSSAKTNPRVENKSFSGPGKARCLTFICVEACLGSSQTWVPTQRELLRQRASNVVWRERPNHPTPLPVFCSREKWYREFYLPVNDGGSKYSENLLCVIIMVQVLKTNH